MSRRFAKILHYLSTLLGVWANRVADRSGWCVLHERPIADCYLALNGVAPRGDRTP